MKKKQVKHFVPNKDKYGDNRGEMGTPACKCFGYSHCTQDFYFLPTLPEEIAKTRKQVTCKNCRRTRVFRKIK